MKLSTRSRYGTRMMLELAKHYQNGPVQISEIANRSGISVKYLEQLIIPLKKAGLIQSIRGPKGGHMLTEDPNNVTVLQIVKLLELDSNLSPCIENPEKCDRVENCATRDLWVSANEALSETLQNSTLTSLLEKEKSAEKNKNN